MRLLLSAALAAVLAASPAATQTLQTGFADFGSDRNTPIEIEADALEVQDRASIAVFTGNVTVRQDEAALQTSRLTVHYAGNPADGGEPAAGEAQQGTPATPGNQRISRLEAEGEVLITADGQSATGRSGTVDFDARTLALTGDVTLSQEGNVVTGDTLTVDLNTGVARVQSAGRVRVLLTPGGGGG
ncbi:LptA/OstA family protein [Acuticoccus sp.]|uniref:LptA/OstA family protein n=1 Tax=Acuticoccus sp. TaxID=1904378 RepID=UPI003B523356